MTTSSHADTGVPGFGGLVALFLEVQRSQWQDMLRFQDSLATFYKDLWEQWAVRLAGPAPFDG